MTSQQQHNNFKMLCCGLNWGKVGHCVPPYVWLQTYNRHEPPFIRPVNFETWDCRAPFRGGAGSPSNTMWLGSRPTCMPSFILIYPTVWQQYTNVTDRQGNDAIA